MISLQANEKQNWECTTFECDDVSENEVESKSFDNGKIAVQYFVNQIIKLYTINMYIIINLFIHYYVH